MITPSASPAPRFPVRRSRLAIARDLLVFGLCALVVAGFVLGVGTRVQVPRPDSPATQGS